MYKVRKIPLRILIDSEYRLEGFDSAPYYVNQGDSQLFRQIRIIQGTAEPEPGAGIIPTLDSIVFVDCNGVSSYEDPITEVCTNGFTINGRRFVLGERSASMTRQSILSFVADEISEKLDEVITMGLDVGNVVLSKYYAYRGLMLSSCHCLEGYHPKIIIVPDLKRIVPEQRIKYIYDEDIPFTDKDGRERIWKQKDIAETVKDIKINVFDGCGIHHPEITADLSYMLSRGGSLEEPTSVLWRAPYIKGVTHEVDYTTFLLERGVHYITDVWGEKHSVYDPMIIMSESMYKGIGYFKKAGTSADWQRYLDAFRKYNHCLGVSKWNYTKEQEPYFTRTSYQILQDLKMPYEEFAKVAAQSAEWAESLFDGDLFNTLCFLGLTGKKPTPLNDYCRAILKNPQMRFEKSVRQYITSSARKYIDEMKCGKLWVKGAFKFLVPDLIMFMEHIGGLEPNGCLAPDEFYSHNIDGVIHGEQIIERNPHICHSEHTILKAVSNELTEKYFSRLDNVCMINGKSIVPQKINGADFDGDLVFVIDNDVIKSGIDRTAATVIDIDDKITCAEEPDTPENKTKIVLRTKKNLIGEYSNYSSAYHNKTPQSEEVRQRYEKYVDIISVLTGKSIDYAKTGVIYPMPRIISKYGRPLPYFMKYVSPYYAKQKLSKSHSNLNKLCWELEKWNKMLKWKKPEKFDYHLMIDEGHEYTNEQFEKMEALFLRFNREASELVKLQGIPMSSLLCPDRLSQFILVDENGCADVFWNKYYGSIQTECRKICSDEQAAANIAVILSYEKYKRSGGKFMWRITSSGIVENIKDTNPVLPERDNDGNRKYLGRKYRYNEGGLII